MIINFSLSLGVCIFVGVLAWLLEEPLLTFGQLLILFIILNLLFTFMDIAESLRRIADKKNITIQKSR